MPEIVLVRRARFARVSTRAVAITGVVSALVLTMAMTAFVVGGFTTPGGPTSSRINVPVPGVGPDEVTGRATQSTAATSPSATTPTGLVTTPTGPVTVAVTGPGEMSYDGSAAAPLDTAPTTSEPAPQHDPSPGPDAQPERPPEDGGPTGLVRGVVAPVVTGTVDSVGALVPAVKPVTDDLNATLALVLGQLPRG